MKLKDVYAAAIIGICTTSTIFAKNFDEKSFSRLMDADGWEVVDDEAEMKTWKLRVEGQPVFVMKGEAVLNHPVSKVVQVWMDGNRKSEWLDGFSSARQIDGSVKGLTVSEHSVYDNPWPIADRDFVYKIDVSKNDTLGAIEFNLKNVSHPAAPAKETVGVRGDVMMKLRLVPVDGGKKTKFVGLFFADVKGWIPVWLQNYYASSFPSSTIVNLREQLKKSYVEAHPLALIMEKELLSSGSSNKALAH